MEASGIDWIGDASGAGLMLAQMADGADNAALISFAIYLAAVFALAWLSGRKRAGTESQPSNGAGDAEDGFVSEYFLGSRNLGVWAFALTFAATSASGGSFVGFPSLIYTHGWVLALWIAGYMVVPLLAMGLLGGRLNAVSRAADAITVPDVIERRFASPAAGILATLLIVVFISYFLLAQFKAGSEILITLLGGVPAFEAAVALVGPWMQNVKFLAGTEPDYVLCLGVFSLAVIVYVVYGGFRAVVWTDVMQGVIMFLGVVLLLAFALRFTGGLPAATNELAKRTPPTQGTASIEIEVVADAPRVVTKGTWLRTADGKWLRTAQRAIIAKEASRVDGVPVIAIQSASDIETIETRLRVNSPENNSGVGRDSRSEFAIPPFKATLTATEDYQFGENQPGVYLYPPGPHPAKAEGFLTVAAAFSFFVFWPFGSTGQPSNMVRLMAFKDTRTLRWSLVTVTVYFSFIYFSLVVVFCCARVLLPGMEAQSDRVMPEMALYSTRRAGIPWMAGLLLAAPFAAVMSSVDSFLLMVSSSLVRDIYQRYLNPRAPESRLKAVTYAGTVVVGLLAAYGALRPPEYLQQIIVDASGFLCASFLAPVAFGLFWKRMNGAGAIAGMLAGSLAHAVFSLKLKDVKINEAEVFAWLENLEVLNPLVWSLIASTIAVVLVTCLTPKPNPELIERFFPDDDGTQIG